VKDQLIHRVSNVDGLSPDDRQKLDGFVYALPRTLLTVTVPVKRIHTTKSILLKDSHAEAFAEELGVSLQKENTLSFVLVADGLALDTEVVADPSAVYLVEFDDRNKDSELVMALTELGVITSATAQVERKTVAMEILKVVLGVAAAVLSVVHDLQAGETPPAKVFRDKILDLREQRQALVSGRAAAHGLPAATLELMLKELSSIEAELSTAFTGRKETKLWKAQFELFPQRNSDAQHWESPLLTLWPKKVESTVDATRGTLLNPPPPDWLQDASDVESVLPSREIAFRFEADKEQLGSKIALLSKLSTETEDRSFHYRVPATGRATITETAAPRLSQRVLIAQLGQTFSVPRYRIDSTGRYELDWYEQFGGLKKLRVQTESRAAEGVKEVGDAVQTVLGAIDDSARLKREVEILELKQKKRELEKALVSNE
jgi:hypothetical protein